MPVLLIRTFSGVCKSSQDSSQKRDQCRSSIRTTLRYASACLLYTSILQRKQWYECVGGFFKGVIGYLILMVGANGLITTFRPILVGLNERFQLNAVVIDPYFGLNAANEALESIGCSAAWAMTSLLIAFIWNIILLIFKKWTKLRTPVSYTHLTL